MRPEWQPWPANLAVLHGLFESVHYVIPRGLDQTASVAQLAEQLICNQQVAGSTPAASSACPASRQCRPDSSTHERTAIPQVTPSRKPPAQPLFQPEVTSTTRTSPTGTHHQRAPIRGHTTGTQPKHPSLPLPHGQEHEGSFPSGQRGQTVNLMDYSFAGSNPALPTAQYALPQHASSSMPTDHANPVCPGSRLLDPAVVRRGCSSMVEQ